MLDVRKNSENLLENFLVGISLPLFFILFLVLSYIVPAIVNTPSMIDLADPFLKDWRPYLRPKHVLHAQYLISISAIPFLYLAAILSYKKIAGTRPIQILANQWTVLGTQIVFFLLYDLSLLPSEREGFFVFWMGAGNYSCGGGRGLLLSLAFGSQDKLLGYLATHLATAHSSYPNCDLRRITWIYHRRQLQRSES